MSVSHTVYGLRLTANEAIPGLALQSASQTPDVRIRLKGTPPFPPAFSEPLNYFYTSPVCDDREQPTLRAAIESGQEYFGFFYRDGARFAVKRNGREVWVDWPEDYSIQDACTYLLGPIMGFVLRLRGITCLHSSAIAIENHAIALSGFPGAGKSTLAAAFGCNGLPVLSDDVVALTDWGGHFLVQPGYPRVNLWPDSVRALYGSENALPAITPTWNKRYLILDQDGNHFASEPLPLRCIYILGPRKEVLRDPIIEEIAGCDAVMTLVANTYVNYLLDRDMRSSEFDTLSRIVARIPIRLVRPTADPSALTGLCEAILADAARLTNVQEFLANAPYR